MINRDVTKKSRRKVKAFFLLLIALCMVLVSSFVTLAVEQSGNETIIKASSLQENSDLVLSGDTVLRMDVDRTLKSISGTSWSLFIEGPETLTVDSTGCAINVYAVTAEEGSNLTVKCSDRETYSIQTIDSFIFRGAKLDIDAYYGIKSTLGDITIGASESATILARKGCAYLVESKDKTYTVTGVEVSIQEKKETLRASELSDNADVELLGDTVLEMDVAKTLHSISGEEYRLIINGPNPLTFDTNRSAIYVKELEVNTDLTVNSSCKNEYSIRVKNDIDFLNGDNLIVDAVFGIKSDLGTIVIHADEHIEVYAKKGACIVAEKGGVYLEGQVIRLENEGQGKDGNGREHGVYAGNGVYITATGTNSVRVTGGTYGIQSAEEIRLNGNFTIYSYRAAIYAKSFIGMEGYFDLASMLRLDEDELLEDNVYVVKADYGNIKMTGSILRVVGETGIGTKGDIIIDCEEIDVNATLNTAIVTNTASGNVTLTADKMRITATRERYKNSYNPDLPAAYEKQWKYGSVVSGNGVTISSQDAVITGPTPVFADAEVRLRGNIQLNASGYEAGIKCFSGSVSLAGDISIYFDEDSDRDEEVVFGIYSNGSITATGTGLYITAPLGMWSVGGGIDLDCDTVSVKTTVGYGMEALRQPVHIKGGNLYIETAFGVEDAWRGGDCVGIRAEKGVRLDCALAEIIAPVGILAEEGDVYLNGLTQIGATKKGISVDVGEIQVNGYTKVAVTSGGEYAMRSEKKRIVVDPSLPMTEPAGGSIQANPGIVLDSSGDQALYVEFGSELNEISFTMDQPVEHKNISNKADIIYDLTPGFHIKSIDWYWNGDKLDFSNLGSSVYQFKGGGSYKVTVLLETDPEYLLSYGLQAGGVLDKTKAVVNGSTNKVTMGYYLSGKEVEVTYDFGTCPYSFYTVDLSIDRPRDGQKPSTSVSAESGDYGVWSNNITWYVSEDGETYTEMGSGDKFIGGKYYKVTMGVSTRDKTFAFGWDRDSGTGELYSRIRAYINNVQTELVPVDGQDPLYYAEVSHDFGICNTDIIRNIEVVSVTEPLAGQKPSYIAGVRGTGYQIDTMKNGFADIYWKNPPEKWYYLRDGVRWIDVTDGGYEDVYEHETFILGHDYECIVYVKRVDDYVFFVDIYNDQFAEATMNGQTAEILQEGSNLQWEQQVSYTFSCDENGSASTSFSVSGDVTSYGSEIDDVTIQLYPENGSEPAYEETVVGNEASYTISDVAPGTYTMKVKKKNHVTREYEITVDGQSVELDAKICLIGDISGDGQINTTDNTRMIRHIKKTKLLTGYEYDLADISGEGQINTTDNTKMIRHIKKTKLLW